jgi:hypothetical protein
MFHTPETSRCDGSFGGAFGGLDGGCAGLIEAQTGAGAERAEKPRDEGRHLGGHEEEGD